MKITLTLTEAEKKCYDWNDFCSEFGIGYYALNEGYGHTEVEMTEQQALDHGIIRKEMEM
jgi:hypothetical protein